MAESLKERRNRALAAYESLTRASFAIDDLLDKQCDFFGLTTCQYRALEYLAKWGPTAMGDLASNILFGDSTVSVVTKNLEKMGLVVRRGDAKDGRKAIVHLTNAGREAVEKLLPKRAMLVRAKMCVLSKREQEILEQLCHRLADGDAVKFLLDMTMVDDEEMQLLMRG
jgi:MarR family transcriptional regulator, 2-MHQ and catechol-resistance regulon repressor